MRRLCSWLAVLGLLAFFGGPAAVRGQGTATSDATISNVRVEQGVTLASYLHQERLQPTAYPGIAPATIGAVVAFELTGLSGQSQFYDVKWSIAEASTGNEVGETELVNQTGGPAGHITPPSGSAQLAKKIWIRLPHRAGKFVVELELDDDQGQALTTQESDQFDHTEVAGNSYTSFIYGYSLTWSASWKVNDDPSEQPDDTFVSLTTQDGVSYAAFEAHNVTAAPQFADLGKCLAASEAKLKSEPGTSQLTQVKSSGNPSATNAGASVSAVYTYVTADGSFEQYIECRILIPGQAILEINYATTQVVYQQQPQLWQGLLAGLVMPAPGAAGTPPA